jgi:hypothetical protein
MEDKIKELYIRLLGRGRERAPIVEQWALDNMFMFRVVGESTVSRPNFNFMNNQRLYDLEEAVYRFIVRYGTHG